MDALFTYPIFPTLAVFGRLDWLVVGGYFALMFAIGLLAGKRKKQSTEEYFLGGRSLPAWAVALSFVATTLSAATFYTVPDDAYANDLSYLVTYLGAFVAVFFVAIFFVPRLYRAGTITIYGYLGKRFGEPAVIAASGAFLLGRMLASGSRLFVAALPLCILIFGQREPTVGQQIIAICLIGLVGTSYTVAGGVRAVVWTDTVQFLLVVGAAGLSIAMLLHRIPLSVPEIFAALDQPGTGVDGHSKLRIVNASFDLAKSYTIWTSLLAIVFLHTAVYGVDHDFAQRLLVSKSPTRGSLSMIAAQCIGLVVVMMFMLIGLLLYIYYRRPDLMAAAAPSYAPQGKPTMAYPVFLLNELPTVLSGLAIAGFFAIAQGSMDSAINAMASSAVADLYLPLRRRGRSNEARTADESAATPRVAVALMGGAMSLFAVGCVFAYDPKRSSLLDFVLGVMNYAYAGLLGVFFTALFTKRGNSASVMAALIAGAVAVALMQGAPLAWWTKLAFGHSVAVAWPWSMPIGAAVAFLVCFAGRPVVQTEERHDRRLDSSHRSIARSG